VREGNQWQNKTEPITVSGYEEELAEGILLKMIQIPAGEFQMGSPAEEKERDADEGPQHLVRLRSFFLGQTPVTQAEWKVVAGWPKLEVDLNSDPSSSKGANRPVERVSWQEAVEFCQRLSQRSKREYTLPSEAQWEYSCRAGTTTPFSFGETLTPDLSNYDGNYTYASGPKGVYRIRTSEVDSFPANGWGLHDMHGNVWEWCLDLWHATYKGAPADGRAWMLGGGPHRLLRGGSWGNHPADCRSAFRSVILPDVRYYSVGFRVCCLPQD
jgi:formylglycine-generating enzyme required for sulfatase activity